MTKLEQAIISSSGDLPEYGLSPEASRSARIFTSKATYRTRSLRAQVDQLLEQSADRDLLEQVRKEADKINQASADATD